MEMLKKLQKTILENKSYKNACLILLAAVVLAFICQIKAMSESNKREIDQITRGKEGSLIQENTVYIKMAEDESMDAITIQVDPVEPSIEEVENKWKELDEKLETIILGDNSSLDEINTDMNFPEEIEAYPFMLTYYPDDEEIISKQGKIGLGVHEKGQEVGLVIKAKCLSPIFSAEKSLRLRVYNTDVRGGYVHRLSQYINEIASQTKHMQEIELPKEFEGKEIVWERKVDNKAGAILIVGIIAASALVIGKREEDEKERKRILTEMEMAYPEVISRLTMYMGAGMTVSAAFRRIGEVYEKREDGNPLKKEIIKTKREIEAGISESAALKGLADRCKIPQISKLSSLIIQGSKRGTFGLKESLKEETKDALQERKNNALRLGEKAGTKLLLPMVLMLIMVMAIIMIPAFVSFGI